MSCDGIDAPLIGDIGERLDLAIAQGRTFLPLEFQMLSPDGSLLPAPVDEPIPESAFVPVNLTGCTIRAHIRKRVADVAPAAVFQCDIVAPLEGRYTLSLDETVTTTLVAGANLRQPDSLYVWDAELVDSAGNILPLYYGQVLVQRRVTRV